MIITRSIESKDGQAIKFTQCTTDNHEIETLYVDYYNKHIICYSTQIGCTGKCKFCYTGIEGKFIRNLTHQEMVDQCINVISVVNPSTDKPILFSAMGIGDPLDNVYEYTIGVRKLHNAFPSSKFALATRIPDPHSIDALEFHASSIPIKLTVSLHTADQYLRSLLIPNSVSIDTILDTILSYDKRHHNSVEYNVTLIDGVNDSDDHAVDIARLLVPIYRPEFMVPKIKINRFNEIPNSVFKPSKRVDQFIDVLRSYGADVEYYETNGSDIQGACGQMISI